MTVYVDDVKHPYRRMIMCHMWADTLEELVAMADAIGLDRRHLQKPPKASWVHFDVCLDFKRKAMSLGAVLTDKYGPLEHVARLRKDEKTLSRIMETRRRTSVQPPPQQMAMDF